MDEKQGEVHPDEDKGNSPPECLKEEITVKGESLRCVQATAEEKAAIERALAIQETGTSNIQHPTPNIEPTARQCPPASDFGETGPPASDFGAAWKAAGAKLVAVLFLVATVTTAPATGPRQPTGRAVHHGGAGHKTVPSGRAGRRSHGVRRGKEEDGDENAETSNIERPTSNIEWGPPASDFGAAGPPASGFGAASEIREMVAGIHRDLAAVRKDFGGTRDVPAPVPDSVARQVFAVVKELESGGRWRKAPILRVFRLYCMEGLAAVNVARRCGCSTALVSLRLKQLRTKLGRDPAELRQLSPQFEQIEDSIRDPRARRIFRKDAEAGE